MQTNKALVIGREGQRKETITSSPPPIVGCGRTVIDGLSPLKSKHGFDRDTYRAQEVFSSSQMRWACDRTVKKIVGYSPLESKHGLCRDNYIFRIKRIDKARKEFSPPPNEQGCD
ncbi:MAG: hypothetical protein CVV39_05940 [Planctomycetes bacterium HGW-Planctomycetes-1]|nr:MAG: hypothetical protein CVV39_05940 [Planctomycetes bacterium HGW-Planctomycetes-1]